MNTNNRRANSQIELTADGSHTLFVPHLNEHYHSTNGAVQESAYIFINKGLHTCQKEEIDIFEVGFGTGLNAFLTLLDVAETPRKIHYTSIEAFPLAMNVVQQLNYPSYTTEEEKFTPFYTTLHEVVWGIESKISPNFWLTKIEGDFTLYARNQLATKLFDILYFDAFSPDKQGEMWTQEIFDYLYSVLKPQGILVTYCAKGAVRRMMQTAGFTTERLAGPPGKREMLRATKIITNK